MNWSIISIYAEIEEAYAFITQKHYDFASCLQDKDCLAKGPGSLFEFCHDDSHMWEPAGGQIGDGLANHSQFLGWLYWPHHPPEQRPIDQSDISTRKKFFNHPWHWLATVGFLSLCRWSATSCRQPWCNCKALTYTFPFWIVGITRNAQQWPPGKFEAGLNSSLPWPTANLQRRTCQPLYFDIAQTVHQTILGVPASETYMNGSTGSTTVHCLPCAGNPSWGECPPHSPFSDHFFQWLGACLLPEIVHFLGVDSLCCAGACAPVFVYPKYEPICTSWRHCDVRRCGNVTSAIPGQKKVHNCFADLVMGDDGHEVRLTAVPTIVMLHVELRSIVSAIVRV